MLNVVTVNGKKDFLNVEPKMRGLKAAAGMRIEDQKNLHQFTWGFA